ncbi:hypothetical protein GMRT_10845 [Giardia muris]|uniref:Uncharacterized protein n=1 Tax=Giardia muris TaxID=5742 RepID=A0A4Z1T513_GIAMU|nr:hypothetical protein GMRT_10845 [Giardia muris]|eukprot:TNJ27541.1 hypothetical protein GMRT_10845 [Giardia muris]
MNSEQRLVGWVETNLKPFMAASGTSELQIYLSSPVLVAHLLRYLYSIEVTGNAAFTTLLRSAMPRERNLTYEQVLGDPELFQELVSLLAQRVARKARQVHDGAAPEQEDIYQTLTAFSHCQRRRENLREALELVNADICAQQRELKNHVQQMSGEIAELLLRCDKGGSRGTRTPLSASAASIGTPRSKHSVTFADGSGSPEVGGGDYYEEVIEVSLDEASSPTRASRFGGLGPCTPSLTNSVSDDERVMQLQRMVQRITSVLLAYQEQIGEEDGSLASARVISSLREENQRYQTLLADLTADITTYKGRVSELQEKLDAFRATASAVASTSAVGSTPRLSGQQEGPRGNGKLAELRSLLKVKDSQIADLRQQVESLHRTSTTATTEAQDSSSRCTTLQAKFDRARKTLSVIEQKIRAYAREDDSFNCVVTGKDASELLSSLYFGLRKRFYEATRGGTSVGGRETSLLSSSMSRGRTPTRPSSGTGPGRKGDRDDLSHLLAGYSSDKEAIERRLAQLEDQMANQARRAEETRREREYEPPALAPAPAPAPSRYRSTPYHSLTRSDLDRSRSRRSGEWDGPTRVSSGSQRIAKLVDEHQRNTDALATGRRPRSTRRSLY